MINHGKIGKKVWYNEELYTVHTIISPNKYDDFIVLKRTIPDEIHEDGVTVPVEMIMLDCHNDTFCPDSPKVRKIMKRRAALRDELDLYGDASPDREAFTETWMSVFPRD